LSSSTAGGGDDHFDRLLDPLLLVIFNFPIPNHTHRARRHHQAHLGARPDTLPRQLHLHPRGICTLLPLLVIVLLLFAAAPQ
ncbi:Os06g0495632, partial [Oryza sativa Japonica Group]